MTVLSGDVTIVDTSMHQRREARERERLAREFAAGSLTAEQFIAMTKPIATPGVPLAPTVTPERAIAWLKDMAGLVGAATPAKLAELVAIIYERSRSGGQSSSRST